MKYGFLLNGLIELLAGIFLFFNTSFLMSGGIEIQAIIKLYAILASVFGGISLLLWKAYSPSELNKKIYLFILGFHMMVSFHCYGLFQTDILRSYAAAVTHGLIFVILFVLYMQDLKIKTS